MNNIEQDLFQYLIDNIKFLINYLSGINQISWQITILGIIFLFRQDISFFIRNVKQVLFGGVGVTTYDVEKQEKKQEEQIKKYELTEKEASQLVTELQEHKNQEEVLKAQLYFEQTYRLLFNSQLNIISSILTFPGMKVHRNYMEAIYRRSLISSTYPFNNYLNFLTTSQLVTYLPRDDMYSLTKLGTLFLEYLRTNNIPIFKVGANH